MTHELEYDDNMVQMLELIWGDGYMAPGGTGNVEKLLASCEPAGKAILDIGCGIGGPAMYLARKYGATVTGIDLEAPLIERARRAATAAGLDRRCRFLRVAAGPLEFADESFDIVLSSGAVTQTADKSGLFAECLRVLKPGGQFACYEWMRSDREYSDEMHYWFELEGLTYALEQLDDYGKRLREAGFEAVRTVDASDWYRHESQREYERIKGTLYDRMTVSLGEDAAAHFVENWRILARVCASGELRQGYCYARKPATP